MGNLHFLSDIKILGSFASHHQKPVGEKLGAAWRRKRGQKIFFGGRNWWVVGVGSFFFVGWFLLLGYLVVLLRRLIFGWAWWGEGSERRRDGEGLAAAVFLSWSEGRLEWRKLLPAKYANFAWMEFWLSSSQFSCSAGWVPPSPTLFFLDLIFGSSALGWFFVFPFWLGRTFLATCEFGVCSSREGNVQHVACNVWLRE